MPDISVIIPSINDPFLQRTIENVRENSDLSTEFIVINDGGDLPKSLSDAHIINHQTTLGRRVSINQAAQVAKGKYLFILDAHCSMSRNWASKMTTSCKGKNLVYAIIRDMHPETWEYRPGCYMHVSMNQEYTEKWWRRKALDECDVEEESMTITGCAWMITKNRYWELGGYDENLGKYGWDGPEWTCKIWMGENPGRVILRTDVICGHIFGTNDGGNKYRCEMIPKKAYLAYMRNRYKDKIQALVKHFAPVPDWSIESKGSKMIQKTERKIVIRRVDESITKNEKGEIIKKVIETFEYVHIDDGEGPSEEEIARIYSPKASSIKREVWELKGKKMQKVKEQ